MTNTPPTKRVFLRRSLFSMSGGQGASRRSFLVVLAACTMRCGFGLRLPKMEVVARGPLEVVDKTWFGARGVYLVNPD